jgi:hypothetical protein
MSALYGGLAGLPLQASTYLHIAVFEADTRRHHPPPGQVALPEGVLDCLHCALFANAKAEHIVRMTWYVVNKAEYLASATEIGSASTINFRGLLQLHSRYGLQTRGPPNSEPLSQGSDPASYPTKPLGSHHVNRQLHGWILPPLEICAIGAHR